MKQVETVKLGDLIKTLQTFELVLGTQAPVRVCDFHTSPSNAAYGVSTVQETKGRSLIIIIDKVGGDAF